MNTQKTVALLVNLGSTEAPTAVEVRKYLAEFLSDKRIIDLPRLFWLPILYGIILNTRPKKLAKAYKKIWGENEKSPLVRISEDIRAKLETVLDDKVKVALAMRYGNPSIKSTLDNLGVVNKLIILPMFPQYSSATTASVHDAVSDYYKLKKNIPNMSFISNYHDNPLYIRALSQSIEGHWAKKAKAEKLIVSFHSMPTRYIKAGDPYQKQCENTVKLLEKELECECLLTYQSQFGKDKWLEPATDNILKLLAKQGTKTIDIISPGFSADCLETLEELEITAAGDFIKAGGEKLSYIPALNASVSQMDLYKSVIEKLI